jgi:hypothetical protein
MLSPPLDPVLITPPPDELALELEPLGANLISFPQDVAPRPMAANIDNRKDKKDDRPCMKHPLRRGP